MNCLEVIMTRRGIRKFKPDPVKRERPLENMVRWEKW